MSSPPNFVSTLRIQVSLPYHYTKLPIMHALSHVFVLVAILFTFSTAHAKKPVDEQYCEGERRSLETSVVRPNQLPFLTLVCIKTIDTFAEKLTAEEKTSPDSIEKAFKKYCGKVLVDSKEHRLVSCSIAYCVSSTHRCVHSSATTLVHWKRPLPMLSVICPNHFHGVCLRRRSVANVCRRQIHRSAI